MVSNGSTGHHEIEKVNKLDDLVDRGLDVSDPTKGASNVAPEVQNEEEKEPVATEDNLEEVIDDAKSPQMFGSQVEAHENQPNQEALEEMENGVGDVEVPPVKCNGKLEESGQHSLSAVHSNGHDLVHVDNTEGVTEEDASASQDCTEHLNQSSMDSADYRSTVEDKDEDRAIPSENGRRSRSSISPTKSDHGEIQSQSSVNSVSYRSTGEDKNEVRAIPNGEGRGSPSLSKSDHGEIQSQSAVDSVEDTGEGRAIASGAATEHYGSSSSTSHVVYDLEKVVREQNTHYLICPVCRNDATKTIILRKREAEDDGDDQKWECLGCLSFFIRRGNGATEPVPRPQPPAGGSPDFNCLPELRPTFSWGAIPVYTHSPLDTGYYPKPPGPLGPGAGDESSGTSPGSAGGSPKPAEESCLCIPFEWLGLGPTHNNVLPPQQPPGGSQGGTGEGNDSSGTSPVYTHPPPDTGHYPKSPGPLGPGEGDVNSGMSTGSAGNNVLPPQQPPGGSQGGTGEGNASSGTSPVYTHPPLDAGYYPKPPGPRGPGAGDESSGMSPGSAGGNSRPAEESCLCIPFEWLGLGTTHNNESQQPGAAVDDIRSPLLGSAPPTHTVVHIDKTTATNITVDGPASGAGAAIAAIVDARDQIPSQGETGGESTSQGYLKSVVHGGLDVTLVSLGVVASAAGGDAKTVTVIAIGLANLVFGIVLHFSNVMSLFHNNRRKFQDEVGQGLVQGCLSNLSFLFFGALAPGTYGFTFQNATNRYYKMAATIVLALVSIVLLGAAKAHVQSTSAVRVISLLVVTGFVAVVGGYETGHFVSEVLEYFGFFSV